MPVVFPPLATATPEGFLAIGGDFEVDTLLCAYRQGIFPWPVDSETPFTWFSPNPRGILEFNDMHLSRSFRRFLNKNEFEVRFNQDFEKVIHYCATAFRKHEEGTWIGEEIIEAYISMFYSKFAYCVSIYHEQELVGGLYGVCIGNFISGESMFHLKTNASKFAIYSLVEKLKSKGVKWMDTQMVTPIVESFGGKEIPRKDFVEKLKSLDLYQSNRELLFS